MVHADDLALELHQHAPEGLRGRPAFLGFEVGKARVGAQVGQEGVDGLRRPRQKQVDTFGRQQDRAHQAQGLRALAQGLTQHGAVVDAHELVGGDIQNLLHGAGL
ncbi:hypothetical protein D9M68_580750 [compost metagenome]